MLYAMLTSPKLTVSPQRNAKFGLGAMALPHKIDALKNHDFSKVPQIPRFSFQDKEVSKKRYAQGRCISRLPSIVTLLFFFFCFPSFLFCHWSKQVFGCLFVTQIALATRKHKTHDSHASWDERIRTEYFPTLLAPTSFLRIPQQKSNFATIG